MERIDRTDKKSKKKLVVVLKNRSKKLRPRKEKKEIEYIQKGGANYNVTLYSNYTFPDGTTVVAKLQELNGNTTNNTALTDIDVFFTKCVKFLTDDDFATLYLKSNIDISVNTPEPNKINTSANTLLHFQSLILLEMCKRLLDNFIDGKLDINDNDSFTDTATVLKQLQHAMTADNMPKKIFTLLQTITYNLFQNFLNDTKNSKKILENKYPFGLILLNYLYNNINQTNKKTINDIDLDIKIVDDTTQTIKFKPGSFFNVKTSINEDDVYTYVTGLHQHLININKKFNYSYKENDELYDFLKLKDNDL